MKHTEHLRPLLAEICPTHYIVVKKGVTIFTGEMKASKVGLHERCIHIKNYGYDFTFEGYVTSIPQIEYDEYGFIVRTYPQTIANRGTMEYLLIFVNVVKVHDDMVYKLLDFEDGRCAPRSVKLVNHHAPQLWQHDCQLGYTGVHTHGEDNGHQLW